MRSVAAARLLLVPLVLAACTEEGTGPLSEPRELGSVSISATDIELDDGDTLQVFANVLDQHENVFSNLPDGVELAWSTDDGNVVAVDADGRLVGMAPGVTVVRAQAAGGLDATATVRVRPVATGLDIIEGNAQDGLPNTALADSVTLRVVDRHGDGVAGAEVRFRVLSGGGAISPSYAVSDANGDVRVSWTLGPVIGDQQMQAFAPGAGAPIAVDATISQVIFGGVDLPTEATVGGTLAGSIRVDSNLFPLPIGAAQITLSWDPSHLQLQPSLSAGNYDRISWDLDNAAGELRLIGTAPAMVRGDQTLAGLVFDVIGGAGGTTDVHVEFDQLIGTNYTDASAAGVAGTVQITID